MDNENLTKLTSNEKAYTEHYANQLKLTTPVGVMLAKMLHEQKAKDIAAELICMLSEIVTVEKAECSYCNGKGHKRAQCSTFLRIRYKCSGDRSLRLTRGKKS